MSLTEDQVKHVARLASLELDDAEVQRYAKELSDILTLVESLKEVDTCGVDEGASESVVTQPVKVSSPLDLRKDVANRPFSREQLLANGPDTEDGFFRVPQILE